MGNDLSFKLFEPNTVAIEYISEALSRRDYLDNPMLRLSVEFLAEDIPILVSKYHKARKKSKRWKRKYLSEIHSVPHWNSNNPSTYGRYIVCTESGVVTTACYEPPISYGTHEYMRSPHWECDSPECPFSSTDDPVIGWMNFPKGMKK